MLSRLMLPLTAAALLAAAIFATAGATAASTCPTFTVLHNDSIGSVKIRAGQYTPAPKGVTCRNASTLVGRFLDDFDGVLANNWVASTSGKNIVFIKAGTAESITLKPGAVTPSSNGKGADTNNGVCPGTFSVLHNDRIGALKLKKGRYTITTKGLFCWFDVEKLAYFLNYNASGKLPSPWTVVPASMKVQRSPSHYFTLKYAGSSSGGGGTHPGISVRCSNTVTVETATQLASIDFVAGKYYINSINGYACKTAASQFLSMLAGQDASGWTVNNQTATFTQGGKGFQLEPAF